MPSTVMAPAFALFSRFGLVSGIDLLRRRLQKQGHQCGRRLDGRPHQHLQLLHLKAVGSGRLEARYELLDFLLLCQEDSGGRAFF